MGKYCDQCFKAEYMKYLGEDEKSQRIEKNFISYESLHYEKGN